ncbi:hypothetical protein WISP_50311 [Willisornis vidua]|uniref:Uncharacterized protein n=1 Tax=Willisornis vidua TaxID=1566151 RepID=A0ABQ9DJQ0_9PASS|nr:hypothetical protein WISP_50311 [Willisornis vidua]
MGSFGAAFPPACSITWSYVALLVDCDPRQDLVLCLIEPHTTGFSQSSLSRSLCRDILIQQINTLAQLGAICKLKEGALNPLVHVISEDVKQGCPNSEPWGTPVGTGHLLDVTPLTFSQIS